MVGQKWRCNGNLSEERKERNQKRKFARQSGSAARPRGSWEEVVSDGSFLFVCFCFLGIIDLPYNVELVSGIQQSASDIGIDTET